MDDNTFRNVAFRAAAIRKSREVGVQPVENWMKEHGVLADNTPLGTIPAGWRPTFCQKHGAGHCLCSGRHYVVRLAIRNLAQVLANFFKKGSQARQFMKRGELVMFVQDQIWQIAIMSLNPRKPTFISMELAPYTAWGEHVCDPNCAQPAACVGLTPTSML